MSISPSFHPLPLIVSIVTPHTSDAADGVWLLLHPATMSELQEAGIWSSPERNWQKIALHLAFTRDPLTQLPPKSTRRTGWSVNAEGEFQFTLQSSFWSMPFFFHFFANVVDSITWILFDLLANALIPEMLNIRCFLLTIDKMVKLTKLGDLFIIIFELKYHASALRLVVRKIYYTMLVLFFLTAFWLLFNY